MMDEKKELEGTGIGEVMMRLAEPQPTSLMITRKRWLELVTVANELCKFLESQGVKKEEGCVIRRLAEELWNLKKEEKSESSTMQE
jgi:hypothetical protein